MTNYRIRYQTEVPAHRTIDLLPGDDGVRVEWRTDLNRNITSTGIYETVVQHTLRYVTFDCYFREAQFHELETWLSFAQEGQPFSFTKDSTKTPYSTLANAALAGADTLLVTIPEGLTFSSGDTIIIMDSNDFKWEVNEVDTASSGELEIVTPTVRGYTAGSTINWYYYYPSLLLLDDTFDPDRDGDFWHHTFNCVEVRNDS